MYAAYVSHDTVVNLLLEAKADPNKGTPGGLCPLMVAAGCGNESICYFLIQVQSACPAGLILASSIATESLHWASVGVTGEGGASYNRVRPATIERCLTQGVCV